jgi:hypothetical protein
MALHPANFPIPGRLNSDNGIVKKPRDFSAIRKWLLLSA